MLLLLVTTPYFLCPWHLMICFSTGRLATHSAVCNVTFDTSIAHALMMLAFTPSAITAWHSTYSSLSLATDMASDKQIRAGPMDWKMFKCYNHDDQWYIYIYNHWQMRERKSKCSAFISSSSPMNTDRGSSYAGKSWLLAWCGEEL